MARKQIKKEEKAKEVDCPSWGEFDDLDEQCTKCSVRKGCENLTNKKDEDVDDDDDIDEKDTDDSDDDSDNDSDDSEEEKEKDEDNEDDEDEDNEDGEDEDNEDGEDEDEDEEEKVVKKTQKSSGTYREIKGAPSFEEDDDAGDSDEDEDGEDDNEEEKARTTKKEKKVKREKEKEKPKEKEKSARKERSAKESNTIRGTMIPENMEEVREFLEKKGELRHTASLSAFIYKEKKLFSFFRNNGHDGSATVIVYNSGGWKIPEGIDAEKSKRANHNGEWIVKIPERGWKKALLTLIEVAMTNLETIGTKSRAKKEEPVTKKKKEEDIKTAEPVKKKKKEEEPPAKKGKKK
jgi:hypothetical protein